jgi:hypothetical protein
VELLLRDGGRVLQDKLRVQLQYQEEWGFVSVCVCVCVCVCVSDRCVGRHAWMMNGDHVFGKQT